MLPSVVVSARWLAHRAGTTGDPMASALNKKHRKQCKSMTLAQLQATIQQLEPEVREKSSLLECAKFEKRKRLKHQDKIEE